MGLAKKLTKFWHQTKNEIKAIQGKQKKDKQFYTSRTFENSADAEREYKEAVGRLFDVNNWSKVAAGTASFQLYDQTGKETFQPKPQPGDFIKILLPGPTPENWVVVIDLKEHATASEFTVSPSHNPLKKEAGRKTEHFFKSEAKSTFKVVLKSNTITAYEIGKKESINNRGPEAGDRNIINTAISEGGWAGFQDYQWNQLTSYIVYGK